MENKKSKIFTIRNQKKKSKLNLKTANRISKSYTEINEIVNKKSTVARNRQSGQLSIY